MLFDYRADVLLANAPHAPAGIGGGLRWQAVGAAHRAIVAVPSVPQRCSTAGASPLLRADLARRLWRWSERSIRTAATCEQCDSSSVNCEYTTAHGQEELFSAGCIRVRNECLALQTTQALHLHSTCIAASRRLVVQRHMHTVAMTGALRRRSAPRTAGERSACLVYCWVVRSTASHAESATG